MPRSLFISDLHLCPDEPGVADAFARFIAGPARAADALYILGDLFDSWAGDDDLVDPFNAGACAALAGLAQSGVAVFFMRGNRDVLIGPGFARAAQLTLIDDPTLIDAAGERVVLLHGDSLCVDDHAYQAFRTQVRDAAWQAKFLAQDLASRKAFIAGLRAHSETAKQSKTPEIMDANPAAVDAAFAEHNATLMIHGHTHRPACHRHGGGAAPRTRWVLPDWCAQPGYLVAEPEGVRAVTLD